MCGTVVGIVTDSSSAQLTAAKDIYQNKRKKRHEHYIHNEQIVGIFDFRANFVENVKYSRGNFSVRMKLYFLF